MHSKRFHRSEISEHLNILEDLPTILHDFSDAHSILTTFLNSIFDGIYVVDRNRRIIFWNKGAEEITGYRSDEVMGRCCGDNILNHIDKNGRLLCKSRCPLMETLQTGNHIKAKIYALHKRGGRIPVLTHIVPFRNEQGDIVAGIEVFRDISGEEEYRILQEKFKDLVKKYLSAATLEEVVSQMQGSEVKANIKDLTILYLDVVNFTGFSESHPPEEAAKMLNDLFSICEAITKECNGDIDKFIGDAIMAVFIDANDAVVAGINVLKALSGFNKMRAEEGHEEIQIRIGINSGLVIHGEIGTPNRKDVTVIGDAVNIASRIEAVTDSMCMSISEATRSRLKDVNLFHFYKTLQVKNHKEPISIYKYDPSSPASHISDLRCDR